LVESQQDIRIRQRAFDWLAEQTEQYGELLPRTLLAAGFHYEDNQIRLVGPQGIFKPQAMRLPLSITTAPTGPYKDSFSGDLLLYKYRGTDPHHRDNEGLRQAMLECVPLVYLHGIVQGKYVAAWPVFVVADNPIGLTFSVAVDDAAANGLPDRISEATAVSPQDEGRRAWVTREFRQRLHQQGFREKVLRAYRQQCALCRLRHVELLDAAHIIPDAEADGEPIVSNGLALCKLHHAAYDRHFVGIRPDYLVEVRQDILEESDGPMLLHGLQGMHGQRIQLPRTVEWQPDPERLARRYARFCAAE
jgi:putative restriction endonuclease